LVITFLNPAVAVLLGVLLLDEPFTLGLGIGLPVILVGCVLATRRSTAREVVPVPAVDVPERG
jgi:drug/metabolite transporter (DMT)-like permease